MPHLRCEYSAGLEAHLDMEVLGRTLHAAMAETGVFPLGGIRVKMHRCSLAMVGDANPGHGVVNHFLALELSVGAGRDKDVLAEAGRQLFQVAEAVCAGQLAAPHFMLSLEIREIDPELSWKANSIHARLAADNATG
ncbi:5-carboxymethyl-2-hydroxymuconate isomerase [Sagittula sp. P11]|uniref:5-carboxymethyl-2-hydroxymuconate Delta-isomerase n=1 Tax=unclassified Sagittula TaxID=2624628 RepID=UPI000C2CEB02|nr:5-carboxymethyl-2-hydroxymuconate Delta-isomerase [Sagittula sp. P11]AUC54699.1 5-carboxymethyl-2-hydroxymuconate isomerase [Sagittula sp. P11]